MFPDRVVGGNDAVILCEPRARWQSPNTKQQTGTYEASSERIHGKKISEAGSLHNHDEYFHDYVAYATLHDIGLILDEAEKGNAEIRGNLTFNLTAARLIVSADAAVYHHHQRGTLG